MKPGQRIALAVAAANLALILAFPPFDVYSVANVRVPVFGGFLPFTARDGYHVVNVSFLALEVIVVLINAAIAWLLLGTLGRPGAAMRLQNTVLMGVGANLVLILLFPPFESVYALTRAALPSFEGFFFVFLRQPHHVVVTALLYLEAILVLVNGGLLWLLLRMQAVETLTPGQALEIARQLRDRAPD